MFAIGVCAVSCAASALADTEGHPTIQIKRASGPIAIDGDLSDGGWIDAVKIDQWWETNPGDNVEPKVRSVGYLTYDDKFFYAAFHFEDPQPARIRAPYGDHDNVPGNIDYGGVILDTRNDHRSAMVFFANPRGIQYDAITDDSSGEDSSPDFYWDSAASITSDGWNLEIRIPFSSLRYNKGDPQEWGILLFRNRPRERRFQMYANKIPRGSNCFVCNENPLTGLSGLPSGDHIVAAPYVTAKLEEVPRGELGSGLRSKGFESDIGLDSKWNPSATTAIDFTLNPDFSQVESDVAAISTNERFAIFFPEKRPFFLEGVNIFATPIQAVYTRTITAPRWGVRSTGKFSSNAYTVLVAQDRGGGVVVLPTAEGSSFANQDFSSTAAIGRIRHDFKGSFLSGLFTMRENQGGGYNRVIGPDFRLRIGSHNTVTGQVLFSDTETPDRPDITPAWNGQKLTSYAGDIRWNYTSKTLDAFGEYRDFGKDFRADDGFIPQVGIRETYAEGGWTSRPKGFFSRVRAFAMGDYQTRSDGALLFREAAFGAGCEAKYNTSARIKMSFASIRSGNQILPRRQLFFLISANPTRAFTAALSGRIGEEVDFARSRLGHGATLALSSTIRPSDRLELKIGGNLFFLNVRPDDGSDHYGRLVTSQVERLRTTYTFNSKAFVRLITQNVRTRRNGQLYGGNARLRSGGLTESLLVAYKVNWQTVLYVGAGDSSSLNDVAQLEPTNRQLFIKMSYAFQR